MHAPTLPCPSARVSFDPQATIAWAPTIAPDSFAAFQNRLRTDEDAAARDVFHRYARRLVALARRQFEKRLAHRIDPEDVFLLADRCLEADYHIARKAYMPLILDALTHDLGKLANPRA